MARDDIDWAELERTLAELAMDVVPLSDLSRDEEEALIVLELVGYKGHSLVREKLGYGAHQRRSVGPRTEAVERMQANIGLIADRGHRHLKSQLGLSEDADVPDFLLEHPGFFDHLRIAGEAIQSRQLSTAFLTSWAALHFYSGRYHQALCGSDDIEQEEAAAEAGRKSSKLAQKYWLAHWVRARGCSFTQQKRKDAVSELRDLCAEIRDGTKQPPEPFPEEFFTSMLASDGDLTDAFGAHKLSGVELQRMAANPFVPAAALPPLSADEFQDN